MSDREGKPPQLTNDEQKEIEEFHKDLDRDLDEQMLLPEKVTSMEELEKNANAGGIWKIIFDLQCEKSPVKKSLGIVLNAMVTNKRSVLLWSRDGIGNLLSLGGLGISSINNVTYGRLNKQFTNKYGKFLHRPSRKDERKGATRRGGLIEVTKGILRRHLAEEAGGEEALCRTNNKLIALYKSSWRRKRRLARSGQNRDKIKIEVPKKENKIDNLGSEKKSGVVGADVKDSVVAVFEGKLSNQTKENSFPTKEKNREFKTQEANEENSGIPLGAAIAGFTALDEIAGQLVNEFASLTENISKQVMYALERSWNGQRVFVNETMFQNILDRVIDKKFHAKQPDHYLSPTGERASKFKAAALIGFKRYCDLMEQLEVKPKTANEKAAWTTVKSDISFCPEMAELLGIKIPI